MHKRMGLLFIVIIVIISSLFGCSQKNATTPKPIIVKEENNNEDEKIKEEDIKENQENKKENIISDKSEDNNTNKADDLMQSPLSGIYAPKEKVLRRPVAVMYDNHPRARWQSGISQAEIVYEFLVEGKYTRYMALFLLNEPELIGPVRSARPYFITTLLEYDPVYVRCGGSEAAKADVKKLKIADIDALTSSKRVFWRYNKTGKRKPHNLYTSMEVIRRTQKERKYRFKGNFEAFEFNKEDINLDGIQANTVKIEYFDNNTTKYVYDEENRVYKRYKDGKLHVDELDKAIVTAKNIIIQRAKTKVIDSYGRLDIELVGKGKGIYITNGKAIDIIWEKKTRGSKTLYFDLSGNRIKLNPGNTWIQVVKPNTRVTIE
ncbi:hypothetical protein TR13x_00950 [Caloranaerobacter sp. TR13]|uniref:DUF3048 domain-containing protein n=1 Tax=Caloranaerobacter sp. TR13 TaxID=1302151 RepID=UPI0006D47CD2|nr:DUF3048 domain-containing protein [Caloranaerobacter sp. TR13]KPU27950.1 hypothetical protein TR13x_00950 [Caloranaerobacter sp. TR13]